MSSEADVQNLPIDIQYSKLRDWLIDRQWIQKDYFRAAKAARKVIRRNLDALPDAVKQGLDDAEHLNYYDCKEIVERLKKTEHGRTNMLGQFTDPVMKTWQSIVSDLEKNNVFLGDCAALLSHDVNFEVPAAHKAEERSLKRIKELNSKEAQCMSKAAASRKRFEAACKDLGFTARNAIGLEEKIQGVQHKLDPIFEDIARAIQTEQFKAALLFYRQFLAFTLKEEPADVLPLLHYLADKGNTAVHTYKTGEEVEIDNGYKSTAVDVVGPSSTEPIIDFGDAPEPTIDFGDDGTAAPTINYGDGSDAPTIDFGDGPEPAIDFGDDPGQGDLQIDFGEEGEAADAPVIDFGEEGVGIVVEESGAGDDAGGEAAKTGTEVGTEAVRESLLHHRNTRVSVVDELEELMQFFNRRRDELSADRVDMAAISLYEGASKAMQEQTAEQMEAHLECVNSVHAQLTGDQVQQLLMIKASPRYVQRLADDLRQKLDLADRAMQKPAAFERQREELRKTITTAKETLAKVQARIRSLKAKVENSISNLYKGRPVHIVGDINAALQ